MRRSWPHMPIMKYMGMSVSSQNVKKRNRSSETKTPIMAVSITRMADEEALHVVANRFPGAKNRKRREERGQQDQEHADSIDAEMVIDVIPADPRMVFPGTDSRICRRMPAQQKQGDQEFGDGCGQRDAANPDMVVRAQKQKCRNAQERQKGNDRQQVRLRFQFTSPSIVRLAAR